MNSAQVVELFRRRLRDEIEFDRPQERFFQPFIGESGSPRRDYYKILNLKKGASAREVKKAYHAGAKKWHPDKNRQPGQEARLEKAERNFKLIARAYEVLSDEAQRRDYDRGVDVDDELYKKRAAAAESGGYHQATGRRKKR